MIYYYPTPSRATNVCDSRSFFGNAAGCRLYLNELDSDVSICVEWEGLIWRFPAHRLVLSAMSNVLRTMFDTEMLEKSNGKIIITDCSALTVKQFLKYLYMGALEFGNWMEAVDLMKIAHKYGVETLITLLETHLTTAISLSNVCFLHDLAQTYSLINLKKSTSNLILDAAFVISATEGFLHLMPKSLDFFLSSIHLNMENECCVLSTLKEWATIECARRSLPLTRKNILHVMEPFMKHISWGFIPEQLRTYVPQDLVEKHSSPGSFIRKPFYIPPSLQYHVNTLKFMVELGAYNDHFADSMTFNCLKFGVDNHIFIAGFKILGLFKVNSLNSLSLSSLTLRREDSRMYTQFNLNSLPWTKGATVGDHVWQELIAYLPYPVRIDPFSTYLLSLKTGSMRANQKFIKWPCTRLDLPAINSELGPINFNCFSECYAITQLFVVPAPPVRNICNSTDTDI